MALLEKSKQAAVATILKPAVQQKQNKKSAKKHRPVKAPKKKPVASRKPKAKTGQPTPQLVLQDMTDALATGITTIHLCGCRHGDFSALKSFSKADVAHYIRPNKFLDGRSCLDCAQAVLEMRPTTASKREVVFYCDQGIKGYDAPDGDPSKSSLTCDLVLCPQCEAKRRVTFEAGSTGRAGSGRKRTRP
jgi:hypothetical protein